MPRTAHTSPRAATPSFIVEVEGYEGRDGSITVLNERALDSKTFGAPDKIYCIGTMDRDGIVRFNDWGYATADEARQALGAEAQASSRSGSSTPREAGR